MPTLFRVETSGKVCGLQLVRKVISQLESQIILLMKEDNSPEAKSTGMCPVSLTSPCCILGLTAGPSL